jgi:16S rRNA (cytosine1402-N4)-methyltransferase
MEYFHIPVLLKEVMKYLRPVVGGYYLDCTLGGMGYTAALSQATGDSGQVVSFDMDILAIENARKIIEEKKIKNIILINENFSDIKEQIGKIKPLENFKFDGIVFDLGLSSAQLEDRSRGFSFKTDSPLNMSFGAIDKNDCSTMEIINDWPEKNIVSILEKYGEERYARNIARNILRARAIKNINTTSELIDIIKQSIPKEYLRRKIHFATKTFQALRIATNNELHNLTVALSQALEMLKPGGRLAVVSFHSLEDRIVKNFFREQARVCICPKKAPLCICGHHAGLKILTKKPVIAAIEEIAVNSRSRSAKLRVGEKT